jgi:redox-sensitive bicupin YhaK (pirin superfamily)
LEAIVRSTEFHWVGDGFYVSTYFPSVNLSSERMSPFLLMDYGPSREFTPLARGKRGVGWHPHRGFETVTLAWEGAVAHRDNAGNQGVIAAGDVQWMTAASGIFHEEYHEERFTRMGGRMHMMQLWVNLPKKSKWAPPGYQAIPAAQIPVIDVEGGRVRVIAGSFAGALGPARTFSPVTMLDVNLTRGSSLAIPLPNAFHVFVVVAEGAIRLSDASAQSGELVVYRNDGSRIELTAESDTHLIVLSGEPIDEPIVQYGPFVMNTVEEIREAIFDVNRGKFGPVPED